MACCAFAVMVLMQLLAPVLWLKRRLQPRGRHNAAASWRLQPQFQPAVAAGGPGLSVDAARDHAPSGNRWPSRRWIVGLVAAELALLLAAGSWLLPDRAPIGDPAAAEVWSDERIWYEAMHDAWCRALDRGPIAG